jgi:hypothetical protein
MRTRSKKIVFSLVGAVLLWVVTTAIQLFGLFGREKPDRGNTIQLPLLLMVLGAPALAYILRRGRRWPSTLLLVVQFGLYVLYETGISINDIRADLLFIYPAILFTAWMALPPGRTESGEQGSSEM